MEESNDMPELANRLECTGCTSCASICPNQCIQMVEDIEGFQYPVIDSKKCVECSLCVKSCPICTPLHVPKQENIAYAAYTKNNILRKDSSSGGIFSEIALVILNQGGVVFGAAYNEQFYVYHTCIETADELYKLRGAKYAQSSLQGVYSKVKEYLKQNRRVLFSGTPCQIAGLKTFLKLKYELLFCVDFVCHGVPSPKVWKAYVEYRSLLDNNGKLPISINMRSKKTGWSFYKYSNVFYYNQTEWSSLSSQSLYMKIFVGDYINRLSCSNCQMKGYDRVSDITLGDFWGIWDIEPDMDDDKGTSLMIVHSYNAKNMLKCLSNKIVFKQVTLEQTSKQNQSMLKSSPLQKNRGRVIETCFKGEFKEIERYLLSEQKAKIVSKGSIIEIIYNRIKECYEKKRGNKQNFR